MSTSSRGLRPLVVLASAVVGLVVAGLLTGMAFAGIGGDGGPPPPGYGHHRHGPVDGWDDGPRADRPGAERLVPPDPQDGQDTPGTVDT